MCSISFSKACFFNLHGHQNISKQFLAAEGLKFLRPEEPNSLGRITVRCLHFSFFFFCHCFCKPQQGHLAQNECTEWLSKKDNLAFWTNFFYHPVRKFRISWNSVNELWESMRWPSKASQLWGPRLRSCSSANLQWVIDFTSDLGSSHYMTSNPWWYLYLGKTKLMTYCNHVACMIYHANHICLLLWP